MEVRRITQADAAALREIRLRALLDSPSAFASSHDGEAAKPMRDWEAWAARASTGDEEVVLLALQRSSVVGIVGGFRRTGSPLSIEVISMWVAPESRGAGVGDALIDGVVGWAHDIGAHVIELWVTVGNDTAHRLYSRRGFTEVGEYQALPSDPCRNETRMRLVTTPGA